MRRMSGTITESFGHMRKNPSFLTMVWLAFASATAVLGAVLHAMPASAR